MSHRLRSAARYLAEQAGDKYSHPRLAFVTSYDPTSYTLKVSIQPEGTETGWLPLAPQWCGDGWGMFAPPPPGAMVVVIFQEGSPDAGIVLCALASDVDRPLPVPAGEAWLKHQSGASVKLTNDGALTLSDGVGASIALANGIATVLALAVQLGGADGVPVQLSTGQPATKVFAT